MPAEKEKEDKKVGGIQGLGKVSRIALHKF